jgi:hypothetical protein
MKRPMSQVQARLRPNPTSNYNGYHKAAKADMESLKECNSTGKAYKVEVTSAARLTFLKQNRHRVGLCGADGFEGEFDSCYDEAAKKHHVKAQKF